MAKLLDVHPLTLRKYADARRVPYGFITKMGNRYRWRSDFADHPTFLEFPI